MSMEYCPYTNSSPPMCKYYKKLPRQLLEEIVKECVSCGASIGHAAAPPCLLDGKFPCNTVRKILEKHGFTVVADNF